MNLDFYFSAKFTGFILSKTSEVCEIYFYVYFYLIEIPSAKKYKVWDFLFFYSYVTYL